MIEAKQLSKEFRDRKRGPIVAVNAVSFVCQPGKIFGLLGANGAGKTTCLRMLATILQPSGGTAIVAGHDVRLRPEIVRARVGFLSASTALYGRLSARECVEYFGRLHGLNEDALRERVDALVRLLGMGEFQDRRCDKLSTGMKQKTSIARTLVHDPPVMIFDEPTLGLDVLAARAIVDFIRDCRTQGKTVIYSTHVMSEVETLCDQIAILHGGRILAEGTLTQLQDQRGKERMEDIFIDVVEQGVAAS